MTELLRFEDYRPFDSSRAPQSEANPISLPISAPQEALLDDPDFIVCSRSVHQLALTARRVAASSASVLITGESGTGKEVLARWIHRHGRKPDSVYIRVNCAALAESLIESELFGHEQGA